MVADCNELARQHIVLHDAAGVVVAYGKSIVVGEISKHFDAVGLHTP